MAEYRNELGLTQEQLAGLVGVRRETIIRLEKGLYNPSLKLAADISRVFNRQVEDVFCFSEDKTPNSRCILIQGAMDIETDQLINALTNAEETILDGFRFVSGSYKGVSIIVSGTQMGKINAALATYIGIRRFAPSLVINQGTAGAHDIDLNVGDIIIGKRYIDYDATRSSSRKAGDGYSILNRTLRKTDLFAENKWQETESISADPDLFEKALSVSNPYGRVLTGTIATGDGFNREADAIIEMHDHYGSDCEEMETFAVAQVCAHLGVPFLGYRVISNNELKGIPFDESSCGVSQEFGLRLLKRLTGKR